MYDGHGGDACSNKLKEVFHRYILKDFSFANVEENLRNQCRNFDNEFNSKVKTDQKNKLSGSCAVVLLILGTRHFYHAYLIDKRLIFINVGDSRAILSKKKGEYLKSVTYDHKPQFFSEMNRIFSKGG